MDTKLLGGILLIIGTSIGGAMLALPITAAPAGFLNSAFLLFACWLIMTFSAFLILEVNLWLPTNSNIVSMAKRTLGIFGQVIAWFSYLLLLYSLIAAYIASGTDVLRNLLSLVGINTPDWLASILFVSLFSLVVFKGIQSVDYVNRALMVTKLGAYIILVVLIAPHLHPSYLKHGALRYLPPAVMVMITSYGFATIVPSLRSYFNGDVKKLKLAILIGSLIPLFAYILWICTILGALPNEGSYGLDAMRASTHTTTSLTHALSVTLENDWITWFSRIFSSVAVVTSFLGVSLGLSDFLADGFGINKKGKGAFLVYLATFTPSLIAVVFYPNAFIIGLRYAGTFCIILLAMLPMMMAWYGRYHKNLSTQHSYQAPGGKPALIIGLVVSLSLTCYAIVSEFL